MTRRPVPHRSRWMNVQPVANPGFVARVGPGHRHRNRDRRRGSPRSNDPIVVEEPLPEERLSPEDSRTWCLAYTLSVDVYVCAERYLMQDFKACIAAYIVNAFEVVGVEAAQPSVLRSCRTLLNGVSPSDLLLKKVFARVGFLQARLWRKFPDDTQQFFADNPELATLIMKEMIERREEELFIKNDLPAMERPVPVFNPDPREEIIIQGPRRQYNRLIYD